MILSYKTENCPFHYQNRWEQFPRLRNEGKKDISQFLVILSYEAVIIFFFKFANEKDNFLFYNSKSSRIERRAFQLKITKQQTCALVALNFKSLKMFPSSLLMKRTIFCFITQNHPELNLEPFSTHFCILRKIS